MSSNQLSLPTEVCWRVALTAVFAAVAHCFEWNWLRFVTSESVFRISNHLGIVATRVSFDIIQIHGELFQFVVSCTFVDVYMGSIPLLWDRKQSAVVNANRLVAAAIILFGFNILRLEIAQILYTYGVSWSYSDGVVGGLAYFIVWIAIYRIGSWRCLTAPQAMPYVSDKGVTV